MRYYKSRAEAGRKLAKQMEHLASENIVVIALSPGSVIVASQIAMMLHARVMLLLMEEIVLPGESEPIAMVRQDGGATFDHKLTAGELDAYIGEFRGVIEEQKIMKFHKINRVLSRKDSFDTRVLTNRTVILVSDGMHNTLLLDTAEDFLKPIKTKRIVVATPFANVPAVDKMHMLADELIVLDVLDNYMFTDHYYEDNTIPPVENLLHMTDNLILFWKRD